METVGLYVETFFIIKKRIDLATASNDYFFSNEQEQKMDTSNHLIAVVIPSLNPDSQLAAASASADGILLPV